MNYFKEVRAKSGLSRITASELLGISWFHLRNIESNQTNEANQKYPSKEVLFKMEEVYQCDLRKLLEACKKGKEKILA